jgi:hypothetical protein
VSSHERPRTDGTAPGALERQRPGGLVRSLRRGRDVGGTGRVERFGAEIVATFYRLWQEAFPDNQCRTVRIVDGGASGALEAVFEGTHTETVRAPSGDLPATGHHVSVPFVNICAFSEGPYTDFVLYFDQIELLTQLGLINAPVG